MYHQKNGLKKFKYFVDLIKLNSLVKSIKYIKYLIMHSNGLPHYIEAFDKNINNLFNELVKIYENGDNP